MPRKPETLDYAEWPCRRCLLTPTPPDVSLKLGGTA